MRVATWNLWHRFGDWQRRAEAITAALRQVDADVVCLQEVWTEEASGRSQAAELAAALGLADHADAHRIAYEGVTFGNAVLSRWPLERHEIRPLPPHPDYEEHRTVLGVDVRAPAGPVPVYCTHLNFLNHHSAVRQAQVRAVAAMALDRGAGGGHPPVVCGDLNAAPTADELRMLTGEADLGLPIAFIDAWAFRGAGVGHTWLAANPLTRLSYEPDRRIDHILVGYPRESHGRGEVMWCSLFGDAPVNGVWASDHAGVVADLAD
ncbi:MAG TPA: endonuclease/exonuclease/phosphatase family protein [Euzebya sp.]|nr:endonuclease/exonuclease/phosphatase family protein [Euzebya sp.]